MSNIRYGDGTKERYTYDTFDQLTQIQNDQGITQTYGYDPEGDRIYTKVEKDDPLDQKEWYNNLRSEDTADEINRIDSKSQETFDVFKEKLSKADDYLCTFTKDYFEIEWSESEAEYVVDKTAEHTEVLWIEEEGNQIYGESERIRSEGADVTTEYINGLNNSVYESITTTPWTTSQTEYSYDDYGNTEDVVQGYGYNGERRDQGGLIYLRARYYNPKIGRFIQIDSYRGEKEQPDTQNRYIYTLNNPYKYTDPSGNSPFGGKAASALGGLKDKVYDYFNPAEKVDPKRPLQSILEIASSAYYRKNNSKNNNSWGAKAIGFRNRIPIPCPIEEESKPIIATNIKQTVFTEVYFDLFGITVKSEMYYMGSDSNALESLKAYKNDFIKVVNSATYDASNSSLSQMSTIEILDTLNFSLSISSDSVSTYSLAYKINNVSNSFLVGLTSNPFKSCSLAYDASTSYSNNESIGVTLSAECAVVTLALVILSIYYAAPYIASFLANLSLNGFHYIPVLSPV